MDFKGFIRGIVLTSFIFGVFGLMLFVLIGNGIAPSTPVETFESFQIAIDEDRIEDAYALQDPATCRTDALEGASQAADDLENMGYSFRTAWTPSTVWINEEEDEALIELQVNAPVPLPTVAHMVKIEGEWRLSCE